MHAEPEGDPRPRILVPVDFSEQSKAAVHFAAELIGSTPVDLLVLHVVHESGNQAGFYRKQDGVRTGRPLSHVAQKMLEQFTEQLCVEFPELTALENARTLLVNGLPSTRIVEVAAQEEPIMIVMGSHGRVGVRHLLLGSVAERVVHRSPHPVMIVKESDLESPALSKLKVLNRSATNSEHTRAEHAIVP